MHAPSPCQAWADRGASDLCVADRVDMAEFANFVGDSYTVRSIYAGASELYNMYPEVDQRPRDDVRAVVALYPTPGKLLLTTLPDGVEVRALYVFTGSTKLMAVCGPSVYSLDTAFTATKIGTLLTTSGPVSMADNGTWLMIADGQQRYAYNPTTGVFTAMSPIAFTATIAGTTMTVTSITGGVLGAFQSFTGAGVTAGSSITAGGPLGPGQTGTFTISPSQTVAVATAMTGTDGGFVATSYVAEVDTFFMFVEPGTYFVGSSSSNSPVSPNVPPATASVDGSADAVVSMIMNNREAFFLKERTAEVWVDGGTFPFPFVRLPGTSIQHGCIAPYSVSRLGPSFAWLAQDSRGQGYVYQMNGYQPVRISTYAVENAIAGYSIISDARSFTYQQGGHEFYVLTFPTADATWVYDETSKMWHKRAWRDCFNMLHRDRANCAALFANKVVAGDWQDGRLYSLDLNVYTDDGDPIWRMRRCPHLVGDLNRVAHYQLQLQFEPGVGIVVGQGSDPQAMLSWSDDGGSTFSNQHWTTVGKTGMYKNRAIWRRLGMARDRIYQVEVSDPVKFVIVSAELETEESAH